MKKWIFIVAVLTGIVMPAVAIMETLFMDTDTLIQRSQEIVIAKCISTPTNANWGFEDGFYPAQMKLVRNLKGERKEGPFTLGTIYPLAAGRSYMLCNSGGSAFDSDFLSVAELSVVEMPSSFSLALIADKTLKEQVTMILASRRTALDHALRNLQHEQALLDKARERDNKNSTKELKALPDMRTAKIATSKAAENAVVRKVVSAQNDGLSSTHSPTAKLDFMLSFDVPDFGKRGDRVWQVHFVALDGHTARIAWVNAETGQVIFLMEENNNTLNN